MALALVALAFAASVPNAGASWTDSWNSEIDMGSPVSQAVVVASPDGIVYVAGGVADTGYSAVPDTNAYDMATGSWTSLDTMPEATRGAAGAMGLDGKVYAFGGFTGSDLSYTQIYDPGSDLWTLGELMPYAAWEAKAATVSNGSIWVVGGEGPPPGTVQIYDPATDSWSIGPSAPAYVLCGALVSVGDDLYYSGGGEGSYTGTANMFKYDSALGEWVVLSDLIDPVAGHAMIEGADGLLYVVGGAGSGVNMPAAVYNSVYAYDIEADAWSEVISMDVARTYLGVAATSDGRILALGGNTNAAVLDVVESLQLYVFEYSMELSSSSVRAGESVILTLDAEFTYVEEYYSGSFVYLVSDADGTLYFTQYTWNPTPGPTAVVIEVPAVVPAGAYNVVIDYWEIYADNAYEYLYDEEFALEVLPAAVPTDELIADLEAQLTDLQAQLDALNETDAALMDEIAALQDQIDALQTSQDETSQDVTDVQTSVEDKLSAMMGYLILGLLVVVIVLLILVMIRGGKSAPPPPAT